MKKKWIFPGAAILFAAAMIFVVSTVGNKTYPPLTGTVVDAETGQPIDGAVVLVEWTKTHGIGEHWTESYKVEETVTDKKGKFTVPGLSEGGVNRPDLTIYKKGYVAWSSRWIFPGFKKREEFQWRTNSLYKLELFKETYSYRDHQGFITASISSTIGAERKQLFFKMYYAGEEEEVIREQEKRDKQRM